VANPLALDAAALAALRGLQTGTDLTDARDPVWDWLEDLGLVVLRPLLSDLDNAPTRSATLTSLGRRSSTT
jgi:hypothetical protein